MKQNLQCGRGFPGLYMSGSIWLYESYRTASAEIGKEACLTQNEANMAVRDGVCVVYKWFSLQAAHHLCEPLCSLQTRFSEGRTGFLLFSGQLGGTC